MKKAISKVTLIVLILLLVLVQILYRRAVKMEQERDRYRQNTESLLADMERIRLDSTTLAVNVRSLNLSVSEFERYRAEDAELIKRLGIRIKNLEAAAKHRLAVEAEIIAPVRDSVIIRDTVLVAVQTVEMKNEYIDFRGIIEDSVLTADVSLPVNLNQAVWVEYKRRWLFWKRVKAVHQTIVSDNPYVDIEYTEYIRVNSR